MFSVLAPRRLGRFAATLALLLGVAHARAASEEADVIVIGGGPAGLAAAIEARLNGAKRVIVIESRGEKRGRPNMLALRRRTVDYLARLGVDVGKTITPVSKLFSVTNKDDQVAVTHLPKMTVDPRRATTGFADLARRKNGEMVDALPMALMPINTMEEALMKDPALDIRFQHEAVDI